MEVTLDKEFSCNNNKSRLKQRAIGDIVLGRCGAALTFAVLTVLLQIQLAFILCLTLGLEISRNDNIETQSWEHRVDTQ